MPQTRSERCDARLAAPSFPDDAARWAAVLARDRAAHGHFLLGVRTTGVYCKPFCPSRTPLRKNVAFFFSCEAAVEAGLRPCKRCKPGPEAVRFAGA